MIDDISELTKENMGSADMSRAGYGSENGPRGPTYGNGSENLYGRTSNTYQSAVDSHGHSSNTISGGTGYYYDDYKHSSRSSGGMGSQKTHPKIWHLLFRPNVANIGSKAWNKRYPSSLQLKKLEM